MSIAKYYKNQGPQKASGSEVWSEIGGIVKS